MSEQGSGIRGRKGPIAWGVLALLLSGALLGSMVLAEAAVEASERDAIDRAEDVTASIVASELTPELVLRDITGDDYRTLIVAIQAGILSDDQVVTVRVWRSDGDLIFSTAQRDETGAVLAFEDPQIQAAAAGQVVSVLSTEVEPLVGLHRAREELFQTYVPVHLVSDAFVDAVVEIDQRYGSIRGDALVLWRPIQFALAGLFVVAIAFAARSFYRRPPAAEAPDGSQVVVPVVPSSSRDLQEAQERVRIAERRAEEAEQRLKDRGSVAPDPHARPTGPALDEFDIKLRAAEAEREQHVSEIQRLRGALAEKEADLALAREGNGSSRAEAKKTNRAIADANRRAAEAEQKAVAAERRATEATQRAVDASGRTLEMEAQVRELEEKAASGGAPAVPPTKRREAGERKAGAELKKTKDELTKTKAELQNAKAELQSAGAQLVTARSELAAAEGDLGRSEVERDELRAKVSDLETALREGPAAGGGTGEGKGDGTIPGSSEPEVRLAEALAQLHELEQARSSLAAELEEARAPAALNADGAGGADAQARIEELERARRSDIAELQSAQEAFANTQVELANSTRKLRESEARIRELEHDLGRPSQGVPTYAPGPAAPRPPSPSHDDVRPAASAVHPVDAGSELDEAIDLQSFEDRVSSLRAGLDAANVKEDQPEAVEPPGRPAVSPPEPQPVSDGRADPAAELDLDPDEEGLSLRERLARAAAARHRGTL